MRIIPIPPEPGAPRPRPIVSDRAPDTIEPIVAYRMWMADADMRLTSLNGQAVWPPHSWTVAECVHRRHRAPDEYCSCGLYSLKEESRQEHLPMGPFVAAGGAFSSEKPDGPSEAGPLRWPTPVIGKVELAGKIIEHDDGYRAERARLVEIIPLETLRREHELVARHYGVPIGTEMAAPAIGRLPAILPLGVIGCSPGLPTGAPPNVVSMIGLTLTLVGILAMVTVVVCLPAVLGIFMVVNGLRGIVWDQHFGGSDWWLACIVGAGAVILLGYVALVIRIAVSHRTDHHLHHGSPGFPVGPPIVQAPPVVHVPPVPPDRPRPY